MGNFSQLQLKQNFENAANFSEAASDFQNSTLTLSPEEVFNSNCAPNLQSTTTQSRTNSQCSFALAVSSSLRLPLRD